MAAIAVALFGGITVLTGVLLVPGRDRGDPRTGGEHGVQRFPGPASILARAGPEGGQGSATAALRGRP